MNKKTILFASLLLGGLPLMGTLSAEAAERQHRHPYHLKMMQKQKKLLQKQEMKLLKIDPYRHPKFGGIRKKPYLCIVIQKKGA